MKKQLRIDRRLAVVVCGILLIAGNVVAQPRQGGGGPPELPDADRIAEMVDEMAVALSLTDEQKVAVLDVHTDYFAEARKVTAKNENDREAGRKAMAALRKDFEKQIKALLDDDQKEAFEALMKKQNNQRGGERGQKHGKKGQGHR